MGHIQTSFWQVIAQFHSKFLRKGFAQKLHFFSTFFEKSDENRGNKHFFGKIMANNGRYTGDLFCTKIAIFFYFLSKKCSKPRK